VTLTRFEKEKAMALNKEDVLEALGIHTGTNWFPIALAGFGVGCLVGAAVALLVTPKSGRELRSNIVERGRDLLGRTKEGMPGFERPSV
jgi:hypothetical protein